ncbi:hypothetical protein pEaSNUABM40_00222 [Erwinia phage pEa_SNUABM_40]|uniref:Uncharacterized protein n=1 Tax=Erwinia phage pEa_SNUABM_3 TaxID=2869552 RepID=A0AAE7XJ71_9CAUD|nr:hypothetical protein MPK68_gp219 [Erwinia phage pEa_SNUABM_3]QZE56416.1 hypothetical protein pEaSNUABM3_00219 [Erwinia phage pEa_SNUABM_3]QZE58438.1 hypothetical protein pEaSNUABM40_00222 [Erwinia phage pEa_SNUABM_40]UAW53000.1 hypothetical protein pEaSNUABM23_00218 [Erwinia phage pEa_SNUABM_23]UIW10896.1 hypothetical protein pEaSNUABM23_00218 [Erwinia phage pEa_SNUABM_31]
MASPYLVKNPTYQEMFPIKWVQNNIVFACPYDGPKKHEAEYRKQINLFFWHVLQLSLYTPVKSQQRNAKFGEVWTPFPSKFGRKVLPMVFGVNSQCWGPVAPKFAKTEKHFSRALEWLLDNVFEHKRHIFKKGKPGVCRRFRIRAEVLECMYPEKPKTGDDLLKVTRLYSPLRLVNEQHGQTIKDMLDVAVKKPFKWPRHDLKALCSNRDREAKKLYTAVLAKLAPNEIRIDPILTYLEQRSYMKSQRAQGQYHHVLASLQSILSGPVQIVQESPLIIRYMPVYRLAKIGGRLFEKGGGFQSFPSELKQMCSAIGTNWDMSSSQLNILLEELRVNGIACSFLEGVTSVDDIAHRNNLPKAETKICFYATIFSMGQLSYSMRGRVFAQLRRLMETKQTFDFIRKWNNDSIPLSVALSALTDIYIERIRETKFGERTLACQSGVKYDLKKLKINERRKRKILNHIFSGIESYRLMKLLVDDTQVKCIYSLEHDGALIDTVNGEIHYDEALFIQKPFSDHITYLEDAE